MIKVDISNVYPFVAEERICALAPEIHSAHQTLVAGTGEGSEFLGWVTLPANYDRDEFARIKNAASRIQNQSEVLIVIGIGGSYLGSRAAIEFLKSPNYNLKRKKTPDIFFAGCNISAAAIEELIELIGGRDFSINVISKSGTTTEPAIAFRIFKKLLEAKYGKTLARERIYATTDAAAGALKNLADTEGYETFVVPNDIGGRFSVLSAVGLLPMAVAGIDIGSVMQGAKNAMTAYSDMSMENPVWRYVAARNACYRDGKFIEILAAYQPSFRFMAEWWKQLYGESEGKNGKGIFPASVDFTADLHSMGQYIQEGRREIFETVVNISTPRGDMIVEAEAGDGDGLNFLAGKSLHFVNDRALRGVVLAHVDGGVPNIIINIDREDEASYGELVYFFELACGISGYTLGVNPFNQPGVEAYKKNMFALIGKPGYEELAAELEKRL